MDDVRFLQLLRQIQPLNFEKIGLAISFADIYKKLTPQGEVKESIEWRIEKLERNRKLEVFRSDSVIYAVRPLP